MAPCTIPDSPEAVKVLSQLRDLSLKPAAVRRLVGEMTTALTPHVVKQQPAAGEQIAVIAVLRSGLAMVDDFIKAAFPEDADIVIYHIGLFREKQTLMPVEYYNKLPPKSPKITRAYVLDPIVATGGTMRSVIDILKDWGIDHITLFSLLGSEEGISKVAAAWPEGTDFFVGAVDAEVDSKGYIKPGLGDIGDRLYGTSLG